MKYYFVYYECTQYGWMPKDLGGSSLGSDLIKCQKVTDIHPLQFQIECNEKYGKISESVAGYQKREEYFVISWNEISKEEFEMFEDRIG